MRIVQPVHIEKEPGLTERTRDHLFSLIENPKRAFTCVFNDGPAVVLRQLLSGCVALPDTIEQPLCAQHDIKRTPLGSEHDLYVVDLSILGEWSRYIGEKPMFVIDPTRGLHRWIDLYQ
jgi:hypothetical protein